MKSAESVPGFPSATVVMFLVPPGRKVPCELVSFKGDKLLLMPYGSLEGIGLGCRVEVENASPVIYPHPSWLGRIINAFGEAIDGKGPLLKGSKPYFIKASPPPAQFRDRVCGKVDLGVRAVNTFLTICKGSVWHICRFRASASQR